MKHARPLITPQEKATVRTVAFFSVFQYPLTVQEVVKYAPGGVLTVASAWEVVDRLAAEGLLSFQNGLVTLAGEEAQRKNRWERYPHAVLKQRKVQRVARLFRWLPGVEGIAVGNSLAYHFTTAKSDADLFIATRSGQTWTARWWTTIPLILLGQRPGKRTAHPIDVSFYADEHHQDFSGLRLARDPYFTYWFLSLSPVLGGAWWARLWEKNKELYAEYPHAQPVERAYAFRVPPRAWRWPRVLRGERLWRALQRRKFPAGIRLLQNKDTRVRVEEGLLKFHTNDRRAEYAEKYEQLCARCGVTPYPSP